MHATALRVPLVIKLLGANALALAVFLGVLYAERSLPLSVSVVLAAVGAIIVFGALASVALLPLRGIEVVASRVRRGDFGARVGASPVADQDMKRIGTTFNLLLDGLVADRERVETLASAIIDAGDRERAMLARELHDSTAQQLAAVVLQLSAAARDCQDPVLAQRLDAIREQTKATLEEVRLLSHTVHPRVLDDLGLTAALKKLGREVGESKNIDVEVTSTVDNSRVPSTAAAVLYRVAQAAMHNVAKHAEAEHVDLRLTAASRNGAVGGQVVLEIVDDGRGFDLADAERRRPGMGLFTMRERVALAGGRLDVESTPGAGTRIVASVPIVDSLHDNNTGAGND
jgi:signal transduction histidine kinase